MSSSSESSLAELPLPYDISSAVSRALRVNSTGGDAEESSYPRSLGGRSRSLSYPTGYYDFPTHHQASTSAAAAAAYNVGEGSYGGAAYYCTAATSPYYYPPNISASIPTSVGPEIHPYYYPHHYHSAIHPVADPQVQMEVEAWTENTSMSICNSSGDLLESQANIEQLDKFCKYIDSSGEEELATEEESEQGTETTSYDCYVARNMRSAMIGSPPKKKRRSSVVYYEEESTMAEEVRGWKMELENASMWKEFDAVGTEMVITKAGRYWREGGGRGGGERWEGGGGREERGREREGRRGERWEGEGKEGVAQLRDPTYALPY